MNQIKLFCSILILLLFTSVDQVHSQCANAVGDTVYVTTTNNVGASLRQAIQCVNSSNNIRFIHFNISGTAPFIITPTPAAPLPPITQTNVVIDATTQPNWTLGTVIVDGTLDGNLGGDANGLEIQGDNVEVYGLFIREFDDNTVGGAGIKLVGANGAIIENNALSGNRHGIWSDGGSTSMTIRNNLIGESPTNTILPNTSSGIQIDITFGGNFIITDNTIANNSFGIRSPSPLVDVLISENSMFCNFSQAIDRGNFTITPFLITSANTTAINGVAPGGTIVEVFKHINSSCSVAPCQGNIFVGSVTVPIGAAAWTLNLNAGDVDPGDEITATATENGENTSTFLDCTTAIGCPSLTVTIDKTDANCNLDNGSATANPSPINPNYRFAWSTGERTQTISNLSPGEYIVTVIDPQNCQVIDTVEIEQLGAPTFNLSYNQPVCAGATLILDAGVTGGTPNYSYAWTGPNGFTSNQENPEIPNTTSLNNGNYRVVVTDARQCTRTSRFLNVVISERPSVSVNQTDADCNGAGNGSLETVVVGGTPNYTYLWTTGATSEDLNNLSPDTYGVTVTDANGCVDRVFATITEPDALNVSLSSTPVTCGINNGSATATLTGGTAPYRVVWSDGQTGNTATGLPTGIISVIVTDANNCTENAQINIDEIPDLSISTTSFDVLCNGAATGSIDLTIDTGTPPFIITWSNGESTEDLTNIPAGTYEVLVRDGNDCEDRTSVTINEPEVLNISITPTDATCGENNGMAMANVTGGTPPYNINWSNGQSGTTALNLAPGIYNATATDGNNCTINAEVTIAAIPPPSLSSNVTNVTCTGEANGRIDLTISNGLPPFTIIWSNGASTEDLENLLAGTYSVTVTDGNNCEESLSVEVTEPRPIDISVTPIDASCGNADGSATASATGGTPPYQFNWSNGQNGEQASNLGAGNYIVSVLDANDCLNTQTVTINDAGSPELSFDTNDVACNGASTGSIDLSITGGTSPYNISWSNGGSTEDITNLAAGTYQVTIIDGADCQVTGSATINEPLTLVVNIIEEVAASSQNSADGQLVFEVLNGTAPYSYSWTGPVNGNSTLASADQATILNLLPGDYNLLVVDNNTCRLEIDFTIGFDNTCDLVVNSTVIQNESCPNAEDGFIELITSGGTTPFVHQWNSNGISGSGNGILIENLRAGDYAITLTDQNNCTATTNATLETVNLPSPSAASLSECGITGLASFGLTSVNAIVNGGSGLNVNWYSDAQATAPITTPDSFSSPTTTVFATLSNQGCESLPAEVSLIVLEENDPSCNSGNCTTQAGSMQRGAIITFCPNETATAIHNNSEVVLDRNDVLEFVLHTQSNDQLGTILGRNEEPIFSYNATNMQTGITYYISAIAGNNLGNGQVDLNDPCLSVSAGTSIIFAEDFSGILNFIQGQDVLCQGQNLELLTNNLNDTLITYHWIMPNGDTLTSRSPRFTVPNVNESNEGEYFVFFTRGNCAFDLTGPLIVEIMGLPNNQIVDAGPDQISCDGTATLNAQAISEGSASWKSLSGAVLGDPLNPQSTISGLIDGENRFVWTVSTGECGEIGSDTVSIIFQEAVFANDDAFLLERANTEIFMDVLKNDNVTPGPNIEITILNEPAFGIAEVAGNGIRYFEKEGLRGVVNLTYRVCYFDSNCQQPCDTANVRIDVLNLPFLPDGITPNNDGVNDVLIVQGLIPGDPSVKMKLIITNRWGDIVFRSEDYSNEQPWGGRFQGSGKALPDGAYFCAIETTVDEEVFKETKIVYIVNSE